MKELEGRIGLLTGGSSGIGYQIANTLADAGATVYAISRTGKVKEDWEESHEGVIHIKGDVTCRAEMKRIVTEVAEEGLDFLFNNAGINKKCRAEVFPMEDYRRIMSVNVDSIFNLCQLCYPYLKESPHKGRIITISSMAAHLGFVEVVPYCISKSAVLGITRGLAIEWANDNICVNSIAPGWFPSEMSKQVYDPERRAKTLARIPLHEYGNTEDLGALARFLLGDNAKYITGQDYALDGGALAFGF